MPAAQRAEKPLSMAVSEMWSHHGPFTSGSLKEAILARSLPMASHLVVLYTGEFGTTKGKQDGVKLLTNLG